MLSCFLARAVDSHHRLAPPAPPSARYRALRLTLLAATIGAAFAARAEQSPAGATVPAAQEAPLRVEVSGSRNAYDARRDDTASKIIVNHDEMLKYGDTGVVDVLKRVPGVTISSSGRNSEVRMRGLGSGYTQILIDGERAPPSFAIDSLSPDVIERIEVLRVAVAEFSTQAIAGTINIVLKKAVKAGQRSLKLSYAQGAAIEAPDASLQLSDRRGQLSYSLAASASYAHNRQAPRTEERETDADHQLTGLRTIDGRTRNDTVLINITPRLTWTFDNGDTLTSQTFINLNRYAERNADQVQALRGPQPDYPAIDQDRYSRWHTVREELNWVHRFDAGVKLDTKLSALYTAIRGDVAVSAPASATAPALRGNEPTEGQDHGLSSVGKLSSTAHAGHSLAAGWDAGRTTRDATQFQGSIVRPGQPALAADQYGIEISRLALYAQDEWTITPNWSAYLGARWEGILVRTDGNSFATARSRSTVWSPLLQTLYKLPGGKGDQLRFAFTRTYKAPTPLTLLPLRFKSANNSQYDPDITGNPKLRPELAVGFDAGYEYYWAKDALLSASVSQRRLKDYIRNVLTFEAGRWASAPVNSGQARTRSLELEAKLPLKAVVDTPLALDLRASVSRNWSTVDLVPGPDNRLDAQIPLSATLGADYARGPLTLGGAYVFKHGGPVRVLANQTKYLPLRRDLDLYVAWQFNARLQLRLAASNLLAQDRVSAGAFAFADAGSQDTRTVTPSHRSVRATLQMKL